MIFLFRDNSSVTDDTSESRSSRARLRTKKKINDDTDVISEESSDKADSEKSNAKNSSKMQKTLKNNSKDISRTQKNNTKDVLRTQKNDTKDIARTQKNNTKDIARTQKNNTKDISRTQKNNTKNNSKHLQNHSCSDESESSTSVRNRQSKNSKRPEVLSRPLRSSRLTSSSSINSSECDSSDKRNGVLSSDMEVGSLCSADVQSSLKECNVSLRKDEVEKYIALTNSTSDSTNEDNMSDEDDFEKQPRRRERDANSTALKKRLVLLF